MTGGVGGDELALISGLGLFNPEGVKDDYKDSYITQNWDDLDLHMVMKLVKGKATVSDIKLIELKEIGKVNIQNVKKQKTKK